jgi:hypothetical protein
MTRGTIIGLSVGGIALLLFASFGLFAASVGKEASKMDDAMKQDLSKHLALDDVKKQLTDESYQITGTGPEMDATGPTHSFVVYSTHLTLKLDFNSDGKMTGYHLDRA